MEPDRRLRAGALIAIGAAWALVLAYLAPEADLSRDDLTYLGNLTDFRRGFEVRKAYGEHGWGLLHTLGHLPWFARAWADGRTGAALSLVGSLAVPLHAALAWQVARRVADARTAWLAAAVAAWSPAALIGAGSLSFGVRLGATGLGLLAGLEAASARPLPRRLLGVAVLIGTGVLIHPWAVVGPVMAAPVALLPALLARRGRRVAETAAGLGLALVLAGLLLGSDQAHRAPLGLSELGYRATRLFAYGFAHEAWQLPGLGRLLPHLPGPSGAIVGSIAVAGLLSWRRTRAVGLLCLGGAAAALPEVATLVLPRDWAIGWTGNILKAASGATVVAAVGIAAAAAALRVPRRTGAALLVVGLVACGWRGAAGLDTATAIARQDATVGRLLGTRLLAGAAAKGNTPGLIGTVGGVAPAAYATRFNPELPRTAWPRRKDKKLAGSGLAGLDYALWLTSATRCELWLGLLPTPQRQFTACDTRPAPATRTSGHACTLASDRGVPILTCSQPPPSAPASTSRDPAAATYAARLVGLLLLCGWALRRPERIDLSEPPA